MKKCLVIGSTVCDIMVYIDKLPKSEEDIHLKNQVMSLGGCAYNVVSVLHNLDIPYTFISPFGKGVYGEFVRNELEKKGIKSEVYSEEENGCCYCLIENNGERTFMSYHKVEYTFNPKWLDSLDLDEYEYIYICGLEVEDVNGKELVDALNRFRGQVVFACGPRVNDIDKELLEGIFKVKPIIHLNNNEVKILGGSNDLEEAVKSIYKKTNNTVVVTLGENGSVYYDNQFKYISGFKTNVVDTVGAGDSHVGGMIAALFSGKNLADSLRFANRVASNVVESVGVNLSEDKYSELRELL